MNASTGFGHWHDYFRARAGRPLPTLDVATDYSSLPSSLADSLAVFQLGESGGGTVIEQARASRLPGVDDDYAKAMAYFVAEEHRHADGDGEIGLAGAGGADAEGHLVVEERPDIGLLRLGAGLDRLAPGADHDRPDPP